MVWQEGERAGVVVSSVASLTEKIWSARGWQTAPARQWFTEGTRRERGSKRVHRLDRTVGVELHAREADFALEATAVRDRMAVIGDIPTVRTGRVHDAVVAG